MHLQTAFAWLQSTMIITIIINNTRPWSAGLVKDRHVILLSNIMVLTHLMMLAFLMILACVMMFLPESRRQEGQSQTGLIQGALPGSVRGPKS